MANNNYNKKKTNFREGVPQNKGRNRRGGNKNSADSTKTAQNSRYPVQGNNDISWYSKYPNLVISAARFPYANRPGSSFSMGNTSDTTFSGFEDLAKSDLTYQVPGVMVMDWVPSIGNSSRATDPASVVAKELYSKVRAKYSGSLDADAPDFMTYMMAMDSIFAYIAYLKRIYRIISAYNPNNYVTPEGLLRAMGFDGTSITNLRKLKVQLFSAINQLVLQSRKFTVPAGMDMFNRHYWMSDNVYTDKESIQSQFYLFNLRAVYKYEFEEGDELPVLRLHNLPQIDGHNNTRTITVANLYEFGLDMIDRLVAWDDAYTINGYLMRAFEGTPGFMVDEIQQDEIIQFVYSEEVLMQIENSHTVPFGNDIEFGGDTFAITQDPLTNSVICDLSYRMANSDGWLTSFDRYAMLPTGVCSLPPVFNIRSDLPGEGDNIIASRLHAHTNVSLVDNEFVFAVTAGTEIPLAWRVLNGTEEGFAAMFAGKLNAQEIITVNTVDFGGTIPNDIASNSANMLRRAIAMEAFAWHPIIRSINLSYNTSEATKFTSIHIMGGVDNVTTVSRDTLADLHKICLYSELNAFSF